MSYSVVDYRNFPDGKIDPACLSWKSLVTMRLEAVLAAVLVVLSVNNAFVAESLKSMLS